MTAVTPLLPAPSAPVGVIGVDLDGTVLEGATAYDDEAHLLLDVHGHELACERIRRAHALGARIVYITGRGMHVRAATQTTIDRARLPTGALWMQRAFTGYGPMADWKAAVLRDVGASLYIGDHAADARAAQLAGIAFLHARHLQDPLARASALPFDRPHLAPEALIELVREVIHHRAWGSIATAPPARREA